jgi:hypothetical protein
MRWRVWKCHAHYPHARADGELQRNLSAHS